MELSNRERFLKLMRGEPLDRAPFFPCTLQMIGGIDKHRLSLGRETIDRELAKVPFMLDSGRYLPAVDHAVPPNVSWDHYRYFCDRLRALIERHPPAPTA